MVDIKDPRALTRDELSKFLPDQRAIRAFEKLFELIPSELNSNNQLIDETVTDSGNANAKANQALGTLQVLSDQLSLLLNQPVQQPDVLQVLSDEPVKVLENLLSVDAINFNLNPAQSPQVGQMGYNKIHDTIDIHHMDGVIQQVGLETYAHIENHTGSLIANGSVLGFVGVGADEHLKIKKYLADGSEPVLYVLGIATQDLPDSGEEGRCTVWGQVRDINTTGTPVSETWVIGDILYASPTTAGAMTKVKPTAPDLSIPLAVVLSAHATEGVVFVRPTIGQDLYYGGFSKTVDTSPAAINTAYAITFDSTEVSSGVAIDGTVTSRIVVDNAGLYQFAASFQLSSGSASAKTLWLWFRKNGVDYANSALKVSLESNSALSTPSRSVFFSLAANDYIELMWAADDTNVTLDAIPLTAFAPAAPSCVLTVNQIQQ